MAGNNELAGKVAIVTGAGRNIGRAIALALAEGGASILVNARSNRAEAEAVAREIEARGGKALVHIGDVADATAVQAMADAAREALWPHRHPRQQRGAAAGKAVRRDGLRRVARNPRRHARRRVPLRQGLPSRLRKSGAGTIVNIGGLSAHTGAKDRAHVVTAKAGIVGFTRALAHDLASDGITVNCVVPGLIGTPRPKDRPEPAHHLTHQTITGARGRPEDVAAAVRFLCSPGARYINGQAIHANGGAYLGA